MTERSDCLLDFLESNVSLLSRTRIGSSFVCTTPGTMQPCVQHLLRVCIVTN